MAVRVGEGALFDKQTHKLPFYVSNSNSTLNDFANTTLFGGRGHVIV